MHFPPLHPHTCMTPLQAIAHLPFPEVPEVAHSPLHFMKSKQHKNSLRCSKCPVETVSLGVRPQLPFPLWHWSQTTRTHTAMPEMRMIRLIVSSVLMWKLLFSSHQGPSHRRSKLITPEPPWTPNLRMSHSMGTLMAMWLECQALGQYPHTPLNN